jgi:hypothetical protein
MEKYKEIIGLINEEIQEFKDHLNPLTTIPKIEDCQLDDTKHCWRLKEIDWSAIPFPNGNHPGLYFLFGHMQDDEKVLGVLFHFEWVT